MNWLGRLLCGVLVATLLAAGPAPTPAQADDHRYTPRQGGIFNVPRSTADKQQRILDHFREAINHAPEGSTIRLSMYAFDRRDLARTVIAAHRRGVHVQILLNDHRNTRAQRMVRRVLGRNTDRRHFIYECDSGCRSRGENQHSKFFLFSKTGAAHNVVMVGSLNFTTNGSLNQYNDLYSINEAAGLYAKYAELFDNMKLDKPQRPAYWWARVGERFLIEATPYQNASASDDPIMDYLNKVKCFGATNTPDNRTIVRVVQHAWNGERGHYLARKVRRLYRDGCDVRLLYGFAGGLMRETFRRATPRGRVPIRSTGYDTNFDGYLDLYTHQKELLISGHFGRDRSKTLVVTGSSNWSPNGVHGDEVIFGLDKPGAMRDYLRQFNWLWDERSYVPRWAGGAGPDLEPPTEGTLARTAALGLPVPALVAAIQTAQAIQGGRPGGPAWEND